MKRRVKTALPVCVWKYRKLSLTNCTFILNVVILYAFRFQEYQIIKKSARSLSTVQVESPWRLAQPSIISSIVLMKGQGKVSALLSCEME